MSTNTELISDVNLQEAINTEGSIADFAYFEGRSTHRIKQKSAFIAAKTWAPDYDYQKLGALHDTPEKGVPLVEKKARLQQAIYTLEAANEQNQLTPEAYELYAEFHQNRLQRIMLVEAARRMGHSDSTAARVIARSEFMSLNEALYGAYDEVTYKGMLHTEKLNVDTFVPATAQAEGVKADLQQFFEGKKLDRPEPELISESLIGALHAYIEEKYAHVLAKVPDTDESVVYGAQECAEIITQALVVGGLAERGWSCVVDARKANPTTSVGTRKILLPEQTARTAAELRRLIMHEQEDHARRGENGALTGVDILSKGTAKYADVEEGLGVLLEVAVAGSVDNPSFHRARDRYLTAGLALGVDDSPRDARQTYEILWRMMAVRAANDGVLDEAGILKAKSSAMVHIENAFRGTNFAMPGVIYSKLKVYYEGLCKNAAFFASHSDDLEGAFAVAMIGKYDHTNPREICNVMAVIADAAEHK